MIHTEFVCAHCGYRERVSVSAFSRGLAKSKYFIGMDAADQRAQRQAESGILPIARRHLSLVACPACRGVNRMARGRALIWEMMVAMFYWPLWVSAVIFVVSLNVRSSELAFVGAVVWVGGTFLAARSRLAKEIRDAEMAVLLTGPKDPAPPVTVR